VNQRLSGLPPLSSYLVYWLAIWFIASILLNGAYLYNNFWY